MSKIITNKTQTEYYPTGEIKSSTDVMVVGNPSKWEKDGDFLKIYPAFFSSFLEQMNTPLDARLRLVVYILSEAIELKINGKNVVYISPAKACNSCKISRPSFYRFIKILININFIFPVPDSNSIYKINPDMVYKGNLVKYYSQVQEETND